MVDARRAGEQILYGETDYTRWLYLLEERAKRDWRGEFCAIIRPVLRSKPAPRSLPAIRRAARELLRSLQATVTFTPRATFVSEWEGETEICVAGSWRTRFAARRAVNRGLMRRLAGLLGEATNMGEQGSGLPRVNINDNDQALLAFLAKRDQVPTPWAQVELPPLKGDSIRRSGSRLKSQELAKKVPGGFVITDRGRQVLREYESP